MAQKRHQQSGITVISDEQSPEKLLKRPEPVKTPGCPDTPEYFTGLNFAMGFTEWLDSLYGTINVPELLQASASSLLGAVGTLTSVAFGWAFRSMKTGVDRFNMWRAEGAMADPDFLKKLDKTSKYDEQVRQKELIKNILDYTTNNRRLFLSELTEEELKKSTPLTEQYKTLYGLLKLLAGDRVSSKKLARYLAKQPRFLSVIFNMTTFDKSKNDDEKEFAQLALTIYNKLAADDVKGVEARKILLNAAAHDSELNSILKQSKIYPHIPPVYQDPFLPSAMKFPVDLRFFLGGGAGLLIGGLIGSMIFPGFGTAIGAGLGGALGALTGVLYEKIALYYRRKGFEKEIKAFIHKHYHGDDDATLTPQKETGKWYQESRNDVPFYVRAFVGAFGGATCGGLLGAVIGVTVAIASPYVFALGRGLWKKVFPTEFVKVETLTLEEQEQKDQRKNSKWDLPWYVRLLAGFMTGVGIGSAAGGLAGAVGGSFVLPGVGTVAGGAMMGAVGGLLGGIIFGTVALITPAILAIPAPFASQNDKKKAKPEKAEDTMPWYVRTFAGTVSGMTFGTGIGVIIGTIIGGIGGTFVFPGLGTIAGAATGAAVVTAISALTGATFGLMLSALDSEIQEYIIKPLSKIWYKDDKTHDNKTFQQNFKQEGLQPSWYLRLFGGTATGALVGGAIGMIIGAILGTAGLPGLGTAAGAATGAITGAALATAIGTVIGGVAAYAYPYVESWWGSDDEATDDVEEEKGPQKRQTKKSGTAPATQPSAEFDLLDYLCCRKKPQDTYIPLGKTKNLSPSDQQTILQK